MNIVVRTYDGIVYCRPDTTWERENKDLYVPDGVAGYMFTPIVFARISKAGKCVATKFSDRYYDSIGFGVLLYESGALDGGPCSVAAASCADHTSILPFPLYTKLTLDAPENVFEFKVDGKLLFSIDTSSDNLRKMMENAVSEVSAKVSLRIGDIVSTELAPMAELPCDAELLEGNYCENSVFDFRVIK